jgi:uncharacterized protein
VRYLEQSVIPLSFRALTRLCAALVVVLLVSACKSNAKDSPKADTNAASAAWTRPFLYVIDGPKKSYVFGTIHVGDPRLASYPPALKDALANANVVNTEIPLDVAVQMRFSQATLLPDNKTIADEVPKATLDRTRLAFATKGLPFKPFEHMRPWFVAMQVALLDHIFDTGKPLDARIYNEAQKEKKEVGGLETVEEQVAIFDALTPAEQVEMLEAALDGRDKATKEKKDPIKDLLESYIQGDDKVLQAALDKETDSQKPLDVKMKKRMITDRNVTMTDRIAERVRAAPDKSFFFAVGSAHVIGPDGIVEKLKAKGFTVSRAVP